MYFSSVPDIKYDIKPVRYPFTEFDFVTTKNFFRRFKVNENVFGYTVLYKKISVEEGQTLADIAYKLYGNPLYDWVLVLSNNIINPNFGLPLDSYSLSKMIEDKYGDDAYSGIHHYETIEHLSGEQIGDLNVVALEGGLIVDHNFYTTPFSYWNGTTTIVVSGNTVSKPVTNYEYEVAENEKKREIFLLRPQYLERFVDEFKKGNLYKTECSDFITKRLKKTGV